VLECEPLAEPAEDLSRVISHAVTLAARGPQFA
jgi:hypothetical protein